ncbi:MAG: DNA repair protein RecO [Acetilactobacillus jinshanensis]
MNERRQLTFHGILLYRKHYGEHSMLIKFMTAECGKKMFLVRGATRNRFKLKADILPFTYGVYTGSIAYHGLSYLKSAESTHHYLRIINNINLNAYATYIMGLIDAAFPDGHPSITWFNKLYYGLRLINQGLDPEIITNIFEIQLLSVFGVAPDLKGCAVCGRQDFPMDYSDKYGGLLCIKHWDLDPHRSHLDTKTVGYLRLLSKVPLKKIGQIHVNRRTKFQLRRLLDDIYDNSVGLRFKSKRFLDQMQRFKI